MSLHEEGNEFSVSGHRDAPSRIAMKKCKPNRENQVQKPVGMAEPAGKAAGQWQGGGSTCRQRTYSIAESGEPSRCRSVMAGKLHRQSRELYI